MTLLVEHPCIVLKQKHVCHKILERFRSAHKAPDKASLQMQAPPLAHTSPDASDSFFNFKKKAAHPEETPIFQIQVLFFHIHSAFGRSLEASGNPRKPGETQGNPRKPSETQTGNPGLTVAIMSVKKM